MPQSHNVFDKISPTALLVAYARGFTDIPYAKELSELVNAQSVVENLLGQKLEQSAEIAILIESRYLAINQVVDGIKDRGKQIIEIASGLLPRGIIMSQNPDVTFIETDLPLMIEQKVSLVNELLGDRPHHNLHFIPVDIANPVNQLTACNQYLQPSEPIIVLCEVLLMYLSHAQKQQVFAHIRELLQLYGGMWITADFATVTAIARRRQISPSLGQISRMVSRLSDRPIGDIYFQNSEQVEDFITAQGFCCDRFPVLSLINIDQLTCLKPLNIDPQIAQAILEDAYVYRLKLI